MRWMIYAIYGTLAAASSNSWLTRAAAASSETLVIEGGTVHPVSAEAYVGTVVIEDGIIRVKCEFCGKGYEFDPAPFRGTDDGSS